MLEPWFQSKGLGDADQVLAYFAVSKLGEPPVDGITDTNPEGLTAAYGKWASEVAIRLRAGGLSCKVKGYEFCINIKVKTLFLQINRLNSTKTRIVGYRSVLLPQL